MTTDTKGGEIAYVATPAGHVFVELSATHIETTVEAAQRVLSGFCTSGDIVLMVGDGDDVPNLGPFGKAANRLHMSYSGADNVRFTRANLLDFFRLFRYKAVFGLTREVVETIQGQGVELGALFPGARLYAFPDAISALNSPDGARVWLKVGPLIALECDHGSLHVTTGEFTVAEAADGTLSVTSDGDGQVIPTNVAASMATDPCACGSSALRIVLKGAA